MAREIENVENMTVAQLRAEAKTRFEQADAIEKKYPNGIFTVKEDEEQVKSLLSEVDVIEGYLALKEDAEARRKRITDRLGDLSRPAESVRRPGPGGGEEILSPGDQFIRDVGYNQLKNSGVFNSQLARVEFAVNFKEGTSLITWSRQMQMQRKALVYSGGSDIAINDRYPGYIDIRQREITVMDLMDRVPTTSDTIEYIRETVFTNAAAFTAEATATTGTTGTKPESTLTFAVATAAVKTLAHWIPVTNRMLSDAPAIRGIINGRLLLGLDLVLETQILTGDGTGENFQGIIGTAGINIQGMGTDNQLDAIFKGRTKVRVNGKGRPNAVVLHPNDWEAIRLSRENSATGTLGGYLMGPPSQVGAVTVWGLPVVESEAETENTGLVGDFAQGATLFDREQSAVRVGTINDQFIRNMQTILAELRAALVVWRPQMFTKVTGI